MAIDLDKGDTRQIIAVARGAKLLRNQLAYVLATSDLETNFTQKPVREAYWLSEGWRQRNLTYYPYYGRGYVQLTHDWNYAKADANLGLGTALVRTPDMALNPSIAAQILVQGMLRGWFTGKKLSDYITLQRSDFLNARRIVNKMDKAAQIADLAKAYDSALLLDGYGVNVISLEDRVADLEVRLAALEASIVG